MQSDVCLSMMLAYALTLLHSENHIALRKAKTLWSFGHSECNRFKPYLCFHNSLFISNCVASINGMIMNTRNASQCYFLYTRCVESLFHCVHFVFILFYYVASIYEEIMNTRNASQCSVLYTRCVTTTFS